MSKKYTVNEAIWIAAAVYAYHKYKTVETLKPSDFYLRTRELIKIAKNYTDKDVQDARIHQHCNGYHEQCTHKFLNKIAVDSGSPYFVVTYLGQFGGEREYPDGLNWNDSVEYEGNQYKLDDIKLYLSEEYAAFVQAHTFLPSVDLKYEEELYTIEQIRNRLSELGYSINNVASGMVKLGKEQSTIHRTKNRGILIYATNSIFNKIINSDLLKDDRKVYSPDNKESMQGILDNQDKKGNMIYCFRNGNKVMHPSSEGYIPNDIRVYSNASFRKVFKVITGADFIEEIVEEYKKEVNAEVPTKMEFEKNIILYGPPGTGKTYNTVIYAVAIIEEKSYEDVAKENYDEVKKRYDEYFVLGQISFTTFHQSYGYEEFIEGIKPATDDNTGTITYSVEDGHFKAFCKRAEIPEMAEINHSAKVWKIILKNEKSNDLKQECFKNGVIRVDLKTEKEYEGNYKFYQIGHFRDKMQIGDFIVSYAGKSKLIDAIGIVDGDAVYDETRDSFRWSRKVNWIVTDICEDIYKLNGNKWLSGDLFCEQRNINISELMRLVPTYTVPDNTKKYVFIIDEINRGNISKIFGELITLIEDTKRKGMDEQAMAILPYSGSEFGVPANVYILGTMNTADRSIATIDTALRRRFHFKEMLPDASVLDGIYVEDVSVRGLFEKMNKRISVLYDREHTLGHAYFTPLKSDPSIKTLGHIFADNIIPLLQEYFYEDYEKIRMVLGDNNKVNESEQFVKVVESNFMELFGSVEYEFEDACTYEINPDAFYNIEAYKKI